MGGGSSLGRLSRKGHQKNSRFLGRCRSAFAKSKPAKAVKIITVASSSCVFDGKQGASCSPTPKVTRQEHRNKTVTKVASLLLDSLLRPYHPNTNDQGQILAVWILAAKLPNSDLNFAVDFCVDFFVLFFPRKEAQKYPPKNPPQNTPGNLVGKISPRISAEAFS